MKLGNPWWDNRQDCPDFIFLIKGNMDIDQGIYRPKLAVSLKVKMSYPH